MSTGSVVMTATGNSSAVEKNPQENYETITIFPTAGATAYTGVTFTVEASVNGTNYEPVMVLDTKSGTSIAGGTSISPTDETTHTYAMMFANNYTKFRVNVGALTTGSATFLFNGSTTSPGQGLYTTVGAGSETWVNGTFSGTLAVGGVSTFTGNVLPASDGGADLGALTQAWDDLFLDTGATINFDNSNWVATHTSGILTVGTGDLRVTTAGTNAASVVTVGGTQTLAAKTLTTPVIGAATGTSLAVTGLLKSSSATAGVGYATGAGGAQTQATDKSTTVVSNTITTAITMNNAALNAGVIVAFTFTNSAIAATDTVIVTHESAGTSGAYYANAFPGSGSAVISVKNISAGNLSEAIVLRVTVIKSVSA